jgi:molecular chaperone GrpE
MRKGRDGMKDSQLTDELVDQVDGPDNDLADVDGADGAATTEESAIDDKISELQRELTLEKDKYLRLAAEFDNYRKRIMKERVEAEARGQGELIRQLLDPLDDIARFAHVDPAVTDSVTLVEGVAMVERKLEKSFRAAGLEIVNPQGEKFDPNVHEAVSAQPTNSPEEDHLIAQVYQVGYTFKGQLLRPARVVVLQYQGTN